MTPLERSCSTIAAAELLGNVTCGKVTFTLPPPPASVTDSVRFAWPPLMVPTMVSVSTKPGPPPAQSLQRKAPLFNG